VLDAGPDHRSGLAEVPGGVHVGRDGPALARIGWSVQVLARRDEGAVAVWRQETWPIISTAFSPGLDLTPLCNPSN
jgi:hypothetical protein